MPVVRPLRGRARWTGLLLGAALLVPLAAVHANAAEPPDDVYELLENPRTTGIGQEPAHVELTPYANRQHARSGANDSPWTASLDGDWKLHMSKRPEDVPDGFFEPDHDTSGEGWQTARVPHTWQTDGLDHPMFRNIPTEMYPDDPPNVPHDVNPTGAYRKTFELPEDWEKRENFLRFEGVTSGYLVWVNGEYVGYDQGGYTPAEFDITEHLRPGPNTIAVQVHRWSAGSHLEDYDQWRYSGIFRSVELYSTPKTYLRDVTIQTDLDADYRDGRIAADVELADKAAAEGSRKVTGTLYDQQGNEVLEMSGQADIDGDTANVPLRGRLANPDKWTDETPNLYRLVVELHGANGNVTHTSAQPVGFRDIEVKDKQVLVNGERIQIKGVNRSETDPDTGRHVTKAATDADIALMKRLQVNSVRTSHYPSDPYFYERADEVGLWVDDEMEVETHHHDNCPDDCLAELPEWRAAFMDRFVGMYERDKNHPSVFMWDTGNEAGLGAAHYAMADFLDANDPDRPVFHQANQTGGDAPYADVWGPRYPSPAALEEMAKSTEKPIIMGEYAHAMGNSLGNFAEFWDVVREYPQVQGGYIWDWADQNIRQPVVTTPDSSGNDILAYLSGMPTHVDGKQGKALYLSGLDDFVEVYRDPVLDKVSDAVTVDAQVKPAPWSGDFTVLAKGNRSYALKMRDENTLEFFVYGDGDWHSATATVPDDWYGSWHRVSGTFDGTSVRLFIDGERVGRTEWNGTVDYSAAPVHLGQNPEGGQENIETRMAHGTIDQVRVYHDALTPARLATDPVGDSVLALNFDRLDREGDFFSYGAGASGADGLVSSDRTVQPEARAMAAVHSPIRFADNDAASGLVDVRNERSFTNTDDLRLRWRVTQAGRTLADGARKLALEPGQQKAIQLPEPPPNPKHADRQLTVEAVRAGTGQLVSVQQFDIGGPQLAGVTVPTAPDPIDVDQAGERITVAGKGFSYVFDNGELTSMRAGGRELLSTGPELDAWRAPVGNDGAEEGAWRDAGLDRLRTKAGPVDLDVGDNRAVVTVPSEVSGVAEAGFRQRLTYTISGTGELRVDQRVEPTGTAREVAYLPRIGLSLRVPENYDELTWYGRGPDETHNDRTAGSPVGVYSTNVYDQFREYTPVQDYGNHEDVRWASLSDGRGGLLVSGDLDVAASPYVDIDRAAYPFAMREDPSGTTLHLDQAVSGVGETFNEVLPEYQVRPDKEYAHTVRLRPLTTDEAATGEPAGPIVCRPEATLTADRETLAENESTRAKVVVENPCDTPMRDVTVEFRLPDGWNADPGSVDVGELAPHGTGTASTTITRGPGTRSGERPIVAGVAATAVPSLARVDARAALDIVGTPPPPTGDARVSALEFMTDENGWGPVERDTSNGEDQAGDGNPITIDGTTYEHGLGVHAPSLVEVYLGGNCTTFTAEVGLDDENDPDGTVVFAVEADSEPVYTSDRLTNNDAAVPVEVDVAGTDVLGLRVTDAGDGNGNDHADWAAAGLRCAN